MFVDSNWLSDKNNDPSIHMMVIILFCLLQKLDTYPQKWYALHLFEALHLMVTFYNIFTFITKTSAVLSFSHFSSIILIFWKMEFF